MNCPNCGAQMAEGSRYCIECGFDRLQQGGPTEHTVIISGGEQYGDDYQPYNQVMCPSCHSLVEAGRTYCTVCGARLDSAGGDQWGQDSDDIYNKQRVDGCDGISETGPTDEVQSVQLRRRPGFGGLPTVAKVGIGLAAVAAVALLAVFVIAPRFSAEVAEVPDATMEDTLYVDKQIRVTSVPVDDKQDELLLSKELSGADTAWVVTTGDSLNLELEDGKPTAKVRHGLMEDDSGVIIAEWSDGSRRLYPATVHATQNILGDPELSAGTKETDEGFSMSTKVEGNAFNSVVLQLLRDNGEYLTNIDSVGEKGSVRQDYVFPYETGDYRLCLKANSNLADELVTYHVHLEEGATYRYAFEVTKLESRKASVKNFRVWG